MINHLYLYYHTIFNYNLSKMFKLTKLTSTIKTSRSRYILLVGISFIIGCQISVILHPSQPNYEFQREEIVFINMNKTKW